MPGFEHISLRIPVQWDAEWYRTHFRDVLSKGDARNVLGTGITVTGNTDQPASMVTTVADGSVTLAKLAPIATDKLLGRSTAGTGAVETITCTAAGRALIDDAAASNQRTTLGLGTSAVVDTGASGATVPLLNGTNTWSGSQTHSLPPIVPTYTVAGVPSAATYARGLIYVSDETGGPVIAFSDGTNWRRVTDRAVIA
jgi:hypothetical protein